MNKYYEALEEVKKLATLPYSEEAATSIKNKECFKILYDACKKAFEFSDFNWSSDYKGSWHIIDENDFPKYSSEDFLLVTVYRDDCDDPYYETSLARFYRFIPQDKNIINMWIDINGEIQDVVAWKKLPEHFDYKAYKALTMQNKKEK